MPASRERTGRRGARVLRVAAMVAAAGLLAPLAWADDLRAYDAANGLLQRGLHELALEEYDTYLANDPEDEGLIAAARYGRAVCLVRLDRHEDALPTLDELGAIDGFEFAAEVAYLRGHAHRRAGRHAAAARHFDTLRSEHPEHPTASGGTALWIESLYRAEQLAKASEAIESASALPEGAARERGYFYSALAASRLGEHADAAERFAELAQRTPTAAGDLRDRAAAMLAQSLRAAGRDADAEEAYERVVSRGGSAFDAESRVGLAELLEQRGEVERSASLVEAIATPESPTGRRATLIAARLDLAEGRADRAAARFEAVEASSEGAEREEAAAWRARALLEQESFADATRVLRRAIRRGVEDEGRLGEMRYDLGVAASRADRASEARQAFEALADEQPKHRLAPDARYALALMAHREEAHDACIEQADRLLDAHPDHTLAADALFLAGESAYAIERYADAAERFEAFASSHADDDRVERADFRRGMSLHRLGRSDDASPLLERSARAIEDAPMFAPALVALADIASDEARWSDAAKWLVAYADAEGVDNADAALVRAGVALERDERFEDAAALFERVLESYADGPHAMHARLELGRSLLELDRDEQAETMLVGVRRPSEDAPPFEVHAMRLLAEIAERRGDSAEAVRWLDEARQAAEGALLVRTHMEHGHALLRAAQPGEAATAFERVLDGVAAIEGREE
ncbi:MAG: tetratricopeptide repeat protein, partial [Planctomycetota bacterium]